MKYRRWLLVAVLLVVVVVAGCISTPEGVKMASTTEEVADKTAAVIETVVEQGSPYAHLIPYGGMVLTLLGGIGETYRRFRPYLVANREIIAGVQKGGMSVDLKNALLATTSNRTKAIIAVTKVKL